MGIFDSIKHAIFGKKAAAAELQAETAANAPAAQPAAPAAATPTAPVVADRAPAVVEAAAPEVAPTAIDVASILDAAVAASGHKLDWRHSIVDMMKALGMESSLAERKELATELHYTGDMHDSASMNIWLHKALMKKLAEHGGTVPADLLD